MLTFYPLGCLYYVIDAGIGLDLAAQIIQHGRDHGIPGYVKWRDFCGLPQVQTFEQLSDVMAAATIAALKSTYRNVGDIDLFTGGLAETPNKGAVVGPTLGCLIGRQFHYLRRGDRYWFENELPPSSFTKGSSVSCQTHSKHLNILKLNRSITRHPSDDAGSSHLR